MLMRPWRVVAATVTWLALGGAAVAQSPDCTNPTSQVEMTACAEQAWQAADGDLNLAYRLAMATARERDGEMPGLDPTNAVILRDAQRAWIPFRDAACTAEATMARGGTGASMLYYSCLEKLTRRRTEDLRYYGETN